MLIADDGDTAFGAGTLTWQDPVHSWKAGPCEVMIVENYTAIPRDMLPLDMLTPQIRHYELRQKKSRYANISDLPTPSYAIF